MDPEKNYGGNGYASESISPPPPVYGETERTRGSIPRRVLDSFKRDPNAHATPKGTVGADGKVFNVESAAQATANSPLQRKLKGRHLQMIAIGGSIGMCWRAWLFELNSTSLSKSPDGKQRYRSVCWFWQSPCRWRAGILADRIRPHWCDAVLHRPRSG